MEEIPDTRMGFIGAGQMAHALSGGFLQAGHVKAENIIASHSGSCVRRCMLELKVQLTLDNVEVVKKSEVVFVAVKPHLVRGVLEQVSKHVTSKHLIVSVAAGITTDFMAKLLPSHTRIIRVMPNTPSTVGCGASVFCAHTHARPEDTQLVHRLLSSVGTCDEVNEHDMDVVTGLCAPAYTYLSIEAIADGAVRMGLSRTLAQKLAAQTLMLLSATGTCDVIQEQLMDAVNGLSGSGPAYGYIAIEALADGAVKMGIPRPLAIKLAAQTMMGAGKMVLETGQHPGELKDAVTSPGGTTIAAIHELEKAGFRAALMSAVEASTNKCKELGKN